MKKSVCSIIVILCCGLLFAGCSKENTSGIVASMTATIGTYTFNADDITPTLNKSQINDTGTSLKITGYERSSGDKIEIFVRKYTNNSGTFSIVQNQAAAIYYHNNVPNVASGGLVAIKDASSNVITGYFNFTTSTGLVIGNANFVCARPWVY